VHPDSQRHHASQPPSPSTSPAPSAATLGELRASGRLRVLYPGVPLAVYIALAFVGLAAIGRWPWDDAVGLAVLAAVVGVAAERPKLAWVDDDLAMTFLPAIALYLVGVVALGLPA